jgi:sirohydrochlorin ferrochelatase
VIQVVLAAHGSRDPRSSATVRALARAVARERPDVVVHDAYLDFDAPHLGTVLAALADRPVIVVPLLLSRAYHARTDIPAIVADARLAGAQVDIADVLAHPRDGGFELMVSALRRRLPRASFDALVLAAAGTRDLEALGGALGRAEGVRCVAGYASGAGRPIADAIDYLYATGAGNVGIASYFLAPGRLHDRIDAAAFSGGSAGPIRHRTVTDASARRYRPMVAKPLGDAAEIVAIASRRIDRCLIESEALV